MVEYREGGGTSMPWTWDECKYCRAQPGQECNLTEKNILERTTVIAMENHQREKNYLDVEKDMQPLIKELVRQERIRQGQPPLKEPQHGSWFFFGVFIGGLCLLATEAYKHFF